MINAKKDPADDALGVAAELEAAKLAQASTITSENVTDQQKEAA